MVAVIQEAWIGGVSTRRVDEIAQAMGLSGISKSQVSKLCKEIDERVKAFLERPLEGDWPYLWLDATYLKVREGGRIVSVAAIIAVAANTEGRREIVGLGIGPSEAETFWADFLKRLTRRGLRGVKLVISDAHEGLKAAVQRVVGATWQRCRVHFMRNALAYVPKTQETVVAAAIRQACIQPDRETAGEVWRHAGAAIHGTLEGLQFVDLSFGLPVAPRLRDSVSNGLQVLAYRLRETLHRVDPRRACICQPGVQPLRRSTAKYASKLHRQAPHRCELGGPRFQRIDAGDLSGGHLAAGFNAKRRRGQRRDRPTGHRIQRSHADRS